MSNSFGIRDWIDKAEKLERALANCKAVAEIQSERVQKLEAELAAMTAHDAWQREQWENMLHHGVRLQERLQAMTADRDRAIENMDGPSAKVLAELAEVKAERDALLKEKELWTAANSDMKRIAEERNRLEKERDALIAENALTQHRGVEIEG
jgi:septal ring factor EnvC (AmiA/AmiB activator)